MKLAGSSANGGVSGERRRVQLVILNWRDTGNPEGGGSEVYAERVAGGLAEFGYAVTMFTAAYPGAASEEVRPDGVRMVRRGGHQSVYWQAGRSFRDGTLGNPDAVIEVHNGVPFLARLWARQIPVIVIVHHVHREQWPMVFGPVRARIGWWLESRVAPRVNRGSRYVTPSDATRNELGTLGVPLDSIDVIHCGSEAPLPARVEKSAQPSLLVLGRLVPHKRIEVALETVAQLRAELPELTLTIAGRGWWEDQLRECAEKLGVTDRVRFAGYVSAEQRHQLYAQSWVSLVPSLKEGWGLVVIEAAAHGTPSVGFRGAGGVENSIIDGVTGLLVEHDDTAAFTAAVRTLLRDEQLRTRLSGNGRTHARQYNWDTTVKAFDRLLADQLSVARRAPR